MLCNVCNDDIYEEDELKCSTCNEFFHFGCAVLRETTFRKMSKMARQKWGCSKCKFSIDSKIKSPIANVNKGIEASMLTNESFINLTDSDKYMSDKFDSFGEHLQELVKSIKDMREENKILKVQNNNLCHDLNVLSNKLNILEQKSLDNFVEIVNVPEIINEDCKNTVKKIAKLLNVEIDVVNAYRVHSKFNTRSKKIVAELKSKQVKKDLIESSRKIKPTGNSVEASWKNEAIYINNNLMQFNRNLFYKTKIFARDSGYKFVWFRNYKLFINKTELTKAIVVDNELSLS